MIYKKEMNFMSAIYSHVPSVPIPNTSQPIFIHIFIYFQVFIDRIDLDTKNEVSIDVFILDWSLFETIAENFFSTF